MSDAKHAKTDKRVDDYLAVRSMEDTASYLSRGRSLAAIGFDELKGRCRAALENLVVASYRSRRVLNWTPLEDVLAELRLRGVNDIPSDAGRELVLVLVELQRARFADPSTSTSWEERQARLGAHIEQALRGQGRPN